MSERILFVQLCYVGLSLIVSGEHACPIELSHHKVVVKHGDPVSVNCSTSESVFTGIGWEVSQGGTSLKTVSHLLWTVDSLTEWNISPLCYFTSAPESVCLKELEVIVYSFPETINISSSSNLMAEGEQHNLTCYIFNVAPVQNLTVRWYKGETINHTDTLNDINKKPSNLSPVFSFISTREDHNAKFRCEAHMDLGPEGPQLHVSSQELSIDVTFGPYIECSAIALREEETLNGKCSVTGFPTPDIKWLKDGQPINPDVPLRRSDSGTYTLKAKGFASVEKDIQVHVLYGPEKICEDTYIISEYTAHNLKCTQGFPPPQEIWYKDDEEVELSENVTRSDKGLYWVNASNTHSSVNFTVEIIVLYPPTQIEDLEDAKVNVGDDFGLTCSSKSNPRPSYFWSYIQMANVKEETEDGVSRLIIHNATGYNIGSYTCHASNEGGTVFKTVRVTVEGAQKQCPIEISPDTMVLQYKSRARPVNCTLTFPDSTNVEEIYWHPPQNFVNSLIWLANTHEDWDPKPACNVKVSGTEKCHKPLNYILYKTPDHVSISVVNNLSSIEEGRELQLQCDIVNVAPAQHLTVRWTWHRGNDTIKHVELNNRSCDSHSVRSPVNVSCTTNVTLNRTHNGLEIRCEALLVLGSDGPEPPPNTVSQPFKINVIYKPEINTTKLPGTIPVFRGYPEVLVCKADGNPPPNITWVHKSVTAKLISDSDLMVYEAGIYECRAENFISTTHSVQVILKEDYLPLIAGFVAVAVVAISVIFLFIYSIYYKNTKMRRYSLKNAKLSTHNSSVAHNGWDMQFPITKLS